ncbi:DUF3871 family protein [Chitinophaga lutea]|uniref:DUF3871 family protein n=1 Tax=Chitinophaga lutea TaxID=2488634 RepID=A0A3N4Q205_9BACT|nr:DUF3871 family protein [Chitinophaga lutea]RPE05804.1 DUF3871 family protein [Chitinophaga lutea]
MEQAILNPPSQQGTYIDFEEASTSKPFLQANTEEFTLSQIRKEHTIPCFTKCNEPLISHSDFIDLSAQVASEIFTGESILSPSIRLSHPIKGRVPEAKEKAAKDLLEHEKTLYYERMAFVIEVPSITDNVEGNKLTLTLGGVKAYNLENLYARKGADEHFKVFIGFQNKVCTNLCVWTDGYMADLKVKNAGQLKNAIYSLFSQYNAAQHIQKLRNFTQYDISEQQFVHLIGKCKLYNYLPPGLKSGISPLMFGDTQLSTVCRDYYRDDSFCRNEDGSINLWRLYNLFTGANKSSYIDTFLDRSLNAFQFTEEIRQALDNHQTSWFLN